MSKENLHHAHQRVYTARGGSSISCMGAECVTHVVHRQSRLLFAHQGNLPEIRLRAEAGEKRRLKLLAQVLYTGEERRRKTLAESKADFSKIGRSTNWALNKQRAKNKRSLAKMDKRAAKRLNVLEEELRRYQFGKRRTEALKKKMHERSLYTAALKTEITDTLRKKGEQKFSRIKRKLAVQC